MKNNNSLHVVSHPAAPESRPLSPARDRLRGLLEQRAGHERKIAELQAAADRLTEIFEARDRAAAEVVQFDRASAAAVLEWSQASLKPRGAMPEVDADVRLALLTKLASTKENANAAALAKDQLLASMNGEAQAAKSLEVTISFAIAEVVSEEASGAMIDDLRQAVATVVAKQERLRQAVQMVYAMARSIDDATVAKPFFDEAGRLAEVLKAATAPPAPDGASAFAAWRSFAAELRINPSAELKS